MELKEVLEDIQKMCRYCKECDPCCTGNIIKIYFDYKESEAEAA